MASRLVADRTALLYERYLPRFARGRLLDLGCGQVPLYLIYRSHVTTVTCVDWGRSAHDTAHVDVECDLREPLPLRTGSFDTIILSDVLEHVPDPKHLWGEAARVLADDGHLVASVPFLAWIHEAPHDYYRFTEYALRLFLNQANLEEVILQPVGGAPEVLTDLAAKSVATVPLVGSGVAVAAQAVVEFLGRRSPLSYWSNRSARLFPLGYFLVARRRRR
jgi:SAM-dependent methyltransferase